jgi:DNA polymerase-4
VHASSFEAATTQGDLIEDNRRQRWQQALSAADHLRDKFGDSSVTLASGMKSAFRERTHENPADLPGKQKKQV